MGSAMAKGWRWLHSQAGVARVLILMHQVTLDLQMEPEALVEMETVMALEMLLQASVEIEATALVEMEPMDLMEMEEMDLVELEATALVEIEAATLVEMVPAALVETQVETLVVTLLPEVLMETDQAALVLDLEDQDREVLGAIKGLAEEGSRLVMARGQALALATAIKAPRQWPSIRPQ